MLTELQDRKCCGPSRSQCNKKRFTQWTIAFFCAITLCFGVGCAQAQSPSTDDFVGTWVLSSYEQNGKTYDASDLLDSLPWAGFSIAADGMLYLYVDGASTADPYTISGNTLTVVDSADGAALHFVLEGGKLSFDLSSVEWSENGESSDLNGILVFERTSSSKDAVASNFIGSWEGYDVQLDDMDEPQPLSSYDMNASLIIDESLEGTLKITSSDGTTTDKLRLTASEKTTGYIVTNAQDGSSIGSISYFNNSGKDWLLLTVFLSSEKHMQISFAK